MKISKFVFAVAVLAFGSMACHKDEASRNLAGTWVGSWGFGTDVPSFYEHWELEKNGNLNAYYPDGSLYATGSWELDGEDFEAQYVPIGEAYGYTFSGFCEEDEINGTWGDTPSALNGGTFEMSKQ